MEKIKEILSSIKQAPTLEEINKKKIEILTEKSNETMYKKIYDMCENISTNLKIDESENIFFNNNNEDSHLIKKIFFDNLETHKKILTKELNKKGYEIDITDESTTDYKIKYYSNFDMLFKIKISVKQDVKQNNKQEIKN
jgi:hypothetical protein